jgi:hypothetical protein
MIIAGQSVQLRWLCGVAERKTPPLAGEEEEGGGMSFLSSYTDEHGEVFYRGWFFQRNPLFRRSKAGILQLRC